MKQRFLTTLIMAALLVWTGAVTQADVTPRSAGEYTEGNNAFAWDIYERLKGKKGNLFFSPFSLRTALGMTYAGARGETATQMEQVLRFTSKDDAMHSAFAAIAKMLEPEAEDDYQLSIANSLWSQQGYQWLDQFLETAMKHYGSELKEVNFKTAAAAEITRGIINEWVEDKTNRKIERLIPPKALDPNPPAYVRLVLVNAIWFKGEWLAQFKQEATRDTPFHISATQQVVTPLMHRLGGGYRYAETDIMQILELPYQGDKLAMVVLLPKARDGLQELEAMLSAQNVDAWLERLYMPKKVDVYLPKFKMTWEKEMSAPFMALGMTLPFDKQMADLSGMNGAKYPGPEALHIGKVFHKAFVDVNEEGTEAAAATAVVTIGVTSMPPPTPLFRADHPFIFLIRDKEYGNILFLGRLVHPE